MTLHIRVATAADIPELSRVGTRSFSDAYRGTADDADIDAHLDAYFSELAIGKEMKQPTVRYLVGTRGPTTAGLVKLRSDNVPPQLPAHNAIELQQLYVASEHQRAGVGRRLLDAAIDDARHEHADSVWLSVWTDADWAMSFYRGYGFKVVCEIPFRLGSADFTDYLMWYRLD